MKALELKVPPVAVVVLAAAGMWGASLISVTSPVSIPGAGWLSLCLATTGVSIALLGVTEFRSAGTTVDPRAPDQSASLVLGGVYRYSRNPMYVGLLLVLCGWGVFLRDLLALLFLPAFVIYMNRFQIIPEERFMREKFGESYSKYLSTVRRWV